MKNLSSPPGQVFLHSGTKKRAKYPPKTSPFPGHFSAWILEKCRTKKFNNWRWVGDSVGDDIPPKRRDPWEYYARRFSHNNTLANYRDPERNLRALYFQGKSSNCKGCGVSPQTQTSLKKRRTNPAGWRNIGDFGDFAGDEMCGFRLSSYCSYILLNERRKEV